MLATPTLISALLLGAAGAQAGPAVKHRRAGAAYGNGQVLAGSYIDNITVAADGVVQCGQATIWWTGATPPVTLEIGTGGYYVGTTDLDTLSDLTDGWTTWTVTAAAGQDMIFQITDADGLRGYVQNIKVGNGDDWCIDGDDSTSAPASSSSSDYSTTTKAAAGVATVPSSTALSAAASSKKSKSASASTSTSAAAAAATASSISKAISASTNATSARTTTSATAATVTGASAAANGTLAAAETASATKTAGAALRVSAAGMGGACVLVGGALMVLL